MAEKADNDYASMDDHSVDMDNALASLQGDAAEGAPAEEPEADEVESEGDAVEASEPEVEAQPEPEPAPAPTMDAMVQALMPVMAQALGQALAPVLERLPQPAAPEPAPNPWELTGDAALTAAVPASASAYTQKRIAKIRRDIARWEPAANNAEHEKHGEAQRMVAYHREQLQEQYHRAELESQLAATREEVRTLQRQPAIQAIAERARGLVASADALAKNGYDALAAAITSGDDLADIVSDVDWSQPEKAAIAEFERALRISNRAYKRAQARASKSAPAAAKKPGHNPAKAVPPKGDAGNRRTDEDTDFLSMEEHDALHEKMLAKLVN